MSEPIRYFGGIDFSGAREPLANLWTALGEMVDGHLTVTSLRPHAYRADLAGWVAGGWRAALAADDGDRVLWGIGCPLGLPAGAASHLVGGRGGWPALLAWVADRPADEVRNSVPDELRTPRRTDTGGATPPFDLRNYKQVVEGLRWLHELREEHEVCVHPQAPDSAAACALIEVNPAATIQELGLPRRRAPGRPGEVRARAAALRTFVHFASPEQEAIAVTLEDAWDAVVACITTQLCAEDLDQPFRASDHPRAALEMEGWIYRVPATLRS